MSRISSVFKREKHKALIAYITTGYPDISSTLEVASLLAESGCDIIELGIPFSDPMADGVTIQKASHQALLNGVHTETCFQTAAQIKSSTGIPLVFMTYLNPIISYGVEKFCLACNSAGIDGLIIPDLPPGELPQMDNSAHKNGIDIIYMLAPNSSETRIKIAASKSQGFLYLVSVTGVTGVRDNLPIDLEGFISNVRKVTDLPLCIGFGISNHEQARRSAALADGIIIGSRIIQLMEDNIQSYKELRNFIVGVRQSIDAI